MKSYQIAIIFVAAIIVGGVIGFFTVGFTSAGTIDESYNFVCQQSSPSPIEDLNLNVDIGRLVIGYNTSNTDLYVDLKVDLEISGLYMADKVYTNFFTPSSQWWQNTTPSTATFDMKMVPGVWFDPSHWFVSYNITVVVTLRTDIVYDISANTGTGVIICVVPDNVVINDLTMKSGTGSLELTTGINSTVVEDIELQTGTGNIKYIGDQTILSKGLITDTGTGDVDIYFTNATMGGNFTFTTGTGDVLLSATNMLYTQDSYWSLSTGTGDVTVIIIQSQDMGADIYGAIETGTGSVDISYSDMSPSVGAKFSSTTGTGGITYINSTGFGAENNPFTSTDFGTLYDYDFTISTGTGSIDVIGSSL